MCRGCGYRAPLDELRPFRCPESRPGDDVDHVLRRVFDAAVFASRIDPIGVFHHHDPNPFRKFRRLLYSYDVARLGGVSDLDFVDIVDRLDTAIARVNGGGFVATPFAQAPGLARQLGMQARELWIKDETENVSGSHKGRHLMGIMIWLAVTQELYGVDVEAPLAIASCGNAALAAAVLARAAERALDVFVPPDANRRITQRLLELGATPMTCARDASESSGDPCYARFLQACQGESLPFSVQGDSNGLAIEGGCTLAWEMVSAFAADAADCDHLVVQVGGGALAASCFEGLRNARDLGLIERLPRIHTVQTDSVYPLHRAYDRLASRLLRADVPTKPGLEASDIAAASTRALRIRDECEPLTVRAEIDYAVRRRSEFMFPWKTVRKSIAYGILDDETYDWVAVAEGMLETGGIPLVVSERRLAEAHRLAHRHTEIAVEPTGSAGLAGLIELARAGIVRSGETVAILFTGVERSAGNPLGGLL